MTLDATVLALTAGDRVLVALSYPSALTLEEHSEIVGELSQAFPGVQFTLLTGVTALAVQRGAV